MTSVVRRGLLAGVAGSAALNLVTYADMAVRGRPASDVPGETVERGLERLDLDLDLDLSGRRGEKANRVTALGALAGIATGAAVGVSVSLCRAAGVRLSPLSGSLLTAAAAMAAADGPAAVLGVTDPRSWTAADWASDALPHLAYGVVTHGVARGLERREPGAVAAVRPRASLLMKSLLLGVATGSRSSLGLAGAAFVAPRSKVTNVARVVGVLAVGGELVGDKLPQTPSRLETPGLAARFGSAVVGTTALAARENAVADLPLTFGVAGAAVGAFGGAMWRESAPVGRVPAALLEDAVAVGLAFLACCRR